MPKTIKDHLENIFEDLGEGNLKKFKIKLRDRKEEPRVRQATIEKVKDSLDLADLMVNTFTSTGAVPVTLEILEVINCHELAAELRENIGDGLPVARPPLDVVDAKPVQGPKVDAVPQSYDPVLSDDWQRESQIIPCSQQFKIKILSENGQEIYEAKDRSARKRLALLINNRDFDEKAMTRRGAERDEENMEWLLNQLDYEVVKYSNLSGQEMKQAVKNFAVCQEHAYSDSTFVVIMSHGKRDAILGVHHTTDNPDTFPVDDIYVHLNSQNCPALLNKPKVILIQACRGGEHGRVWASDGEPDKSMEIEGDDFVHKEKDFISLMSCTPDTKSYRHVQNGTFYVQLIVDVFTKHAHEDHIEELFRKVIRRFDNADMIGSYRQMACKDRATLAKLFYLFPGL
ncbi:caspase a [Ctenopharyngodon idella]|uniref:caspase a n=1 Tax=Ctenopharyngodon idella TaxID=7959 RepID=UPI00223238EE|nr:caspase a [Ctenopharyngodon idella]